MTTRTSSVTSEYVDINCTTPSFHRVELQEKSKEKYSTKEVFISSDDVINRPHL